MRIVRLAVMLALAGVLLVACKEWDPLWGAAHSGLKACLGLADTQEERARCGEEFDHRLDSAFSACEKDDDICDDVFLEDYNKVRDLRAGRDIAETVQFRLVTCINGARNAEQEEACRTEFKSSAETLYERCLADLADYDDPTYKTKTECGYDRDSAIRSAALTVRGSSAFGEAPKTATSISPVQSENYAPPVTQSAATTDTTTVHTIQTPPGFVQCPGKPNVFIPDNAPIGVCNSL